MKYLEIKQMLDMLKNQGINVEDLLEIINLYPIKDFEPNILTNVPVKITPVLITPDLEEKMINGIKKLLIEYKDSENPKTKFCINELEQYIS